MTEAYFIEMMKARVLLVRRIVEEGLSLDTVIVDRRLIGKELYG